MSERRQTGRSTHRSSPSRSRLSRFGLVLGGVGLAALVLFHLAIFARRLEDLSILQPAVALQWLGTVALLAFLGFLRRRGVSLVAGRSALAFWLVVLLLHLVPATPTTLEGLDPLDLALALPTTWMAWVALLLVVLLASSTLAATRSPALGLLRRRRGPPRPTPEHFRRLFARPPPQARLDDSTRRRRR